MSAKTEISWTDSTWNPIRGCSMAKGSETGGCLNCYAARLSARNLPGMVSPTTGEPFARILQSGPRWTGKVELIEKALPLPLKWRKPRRIFVNSLSDLFHESLTDREILRVFEIMGRAPQHTFQVLTKRPARMLEWMTKWADTKEADYEPKLARGPEAVRKVHTSGRALMFASMLESMGNPPAGCAYPTYDWLGGMIRWPYQFFNVWLGTSIEGQPTAKARIPLLRQTPSALRFLSIEPLLSNPGILDLTGIFWVIVGGESGPGARPLDIAWVRSIIRQCREAGVACFVKQLGTIPMMNESLWHEEINATGVAKLLSARNAKYLPAGFVPLAMTDRKGGDMSEWPEDLRVREFPA